MTGIRVCVLGVALVMTAGCSVNDDRALHRFNKTREPEEFAVLPRRELQMPPSMRELPVPDAQAANRTDQTPLADAVIALGGQPSDNGRVPKSDRVLISAAGRFGTDPAIRTRLAAEDEVYRAENSRFSWQLFPSDRYAQVYEDMRLDPYSELKRFRALGIETPSAPPKQ
jgi:hypothetical protein